jgi:oligopeptide/dipeptide ABC transporter ATP-binding protein
VLGLVGESGSGKSVTALSLLRLLPSPPGRIAAGSICFGGQDLVTASDAAMRHLRGNQVAIVFQEPVTSLNPIYAVGTQLIEPLVLHLGLSRRAARARAIELLERVGVPFPAQRIDAYPHELSGGLRQRVMIAMALACSPKILIADEPTTALDVTIQEQILDLLAELETETGMAVILITHDLGVVAEFADRVAVMYAGRIVEEAPVGPFYDHPHHPYAEGLLQSMPQLETRTRRLPAIEGTVPNPFALPPGCRFAPRCRYARPACTKPVSNGPGRRAACIRPFEYAAPASGAIDG